MATCVEHYLAPRRIARRTARLRANTELTLCSDRFGLLSRARAPLVVARVGRGVARRAAATAPSRCRRVASINLCADQHLLALADPEQILTVSWLAADPEESLFASEAQRHTLNYGTAEELLKFAPDVVLAGTYTSPFTRTMLRRLGYRVVELEPEASVADIERNVRLVAEVVGQVERGEQLVATLRADVHAIEANRPARKLADRHRSTRRLHGRRGLARERAAHARRPFATSPPSTGSTAGAACRWRRCCAARPS